ncbi:MAG: STAS domain-containing protein [Streptosporangiaceae bacterium]|nr:STAS domain-containing protein [Streptosporangiaceae bacterium]
MSTLRASVTAGQSGPVIVLSGEADLSTAAQLSDLITAQLSAGTRNLTLDMSGLSFMDSMSTRIMVLAARTLNERGGGLTLLRPQPAIARTLALMGADQMITIRREPEATPGP